MASGKYSVTIAVDDVMYAGTFTSLAKAIKAVTEIDGMHVGNECEDSNRYIFNVLFTGDFRDARIVGSIVAADEGLNSLTCHQL